MKFKTLFNNRNKLIKNTLVFSILGGAPLLLNSIYSPGIYAESITAEEIGKQLVFTTENTKSILDKENTQKTINNLENNELKSSLQEKIDNIKTNSLTHSSNIDIYIKPQNILSLSLSTNSVTFEDFTGTEDIVILNAIDLSVDSTLPYDLNSYLESDILSIDGDKSMNKSIFNIKESSTQDYKNFAQINEKVTLLSDCESGFNKSHSIDMKLNSGVIEAGVYKAVIKLEIEQK